MCHLNSLQDILGEPSKKSGFRDKKAQRKFPTISWDEWTKKSKKSSWWWFATLHVAVKNLNLKRVASRLQYQEQSDSFLFKRKIKIIQKCLFFSFWLLHCCCWIPSFEKYILLKVVPQIKRSLNSIKERYTTFNFKKKWTQSTFKNEYLTLVIKLSVFLKSSCVMIHKSQDSYIPKQLVWQFQIHMTNITTTKF